MIIKKKKYNFVRRKTWKFYSGGEKIKREMLAATKVKMSGSEKQNVQEHMQHFLHKTCDLEAGIFTL